MVKNRQSEIVLLLESVPQRSSKMKSQYVEEPSHYLTNKVNETVGELITIYIKREGYQAFAAQKVYFLRCVGLVYPHCLKCH